MPRLQVHQYLEDSAYRARIDSAVTEGKVCGFCVFAGSVNEVRAVVNTLQRLSGSTRNRRLLLACDAEWGLPMRFSGECTEFPHALALAKSSYPQGIELAAEAIGKELRSLGIQWNFAPVADVNSDPENPIINIRAFGETVGVVSSSAIRFHSGLQKSGVLSAAKHFPGHGQTKIDSHRALPVLDLPPDHFDRIEFVPFRSLIAEGIPAIMTGHLAAPRLARSLAVKDSEADLPATLSPVLTYKLLREQLGFEEVIVTDSLEMSALKAYGSSAEVAIKAFIAGADILLMPPDVEGAHSALVELFILDKQCYFQAKRSAERIEKLLAQYSTKSVEMPDIEAHRALALNIAYKAIETEGDTQSLSQIKNVCIIPDDLLLQQKKVEELAKQCLASTNWRLLSVDDLTPTALAETAICILQRPRGKLLDQDTDIVLSPVQLWLNTQQQWGIAAGCIILLGNPYLQSQLQGNCTVKTYSDSLPSIIALCRWIQKAL